MMDLFDLFTPADLTRAIEQKLVNMREDGAGLTILNYSDAALYTPGAWDNPAVRQCRGLIIDEDLRIVARPWAKFFNHGQAEAGDLDLDAPVEVTDKLDGSLGIIHLTNDGDLRVATRGSFESEQAIHATEILRTRYPDIAVGSKLTPLVEIVYPANRIVCDYGDLDDLILLGSVGIEAGFYLGPEQTADIIGWHGPKAATFTYSTLREALAAPPRPGMEGLCVRYLHDDRIVKVKQEDYVRLHRIVTGLSERSVWEHMSAGHPLDDLLGALPDELHEWTREVWAKLANSLGGIRHAARRLHTQIMTELGQGFERKAYAEHAQRHAHLRPYLFMLLDGKDPGPAILRSLKPAGSVRPRVFSEDVA